MTIKALVRRPIKRHIRRSVRRAVDLRDYFANDEEGFLGSSAFANLYATYLQAANVTAYGDATGFVKNTLPATDKFLILSGASGVYASTPDSAAYDFSGAVLVLEQDFAARDITPAAATCIAGKWNTTGNQRSFSAFLNTDGTIFFGISTDGTAQAGNTVNSTASITTVIGDAARIKTRQTWTVATKAVVFEYSLDDGDNWLPLGTAGATADATIFNSTAVVSIGINGNGTASPFAGKIYGARILFDGVAVFDLTPNSYVSGSTYTCGTGQTVTLQGIAVIVPNELQFYQPTSAARPAAASWPRTGVFNWLTTVDAPSENLTGTGWASAGATVTAAAATSPNGRSMSSFVPTAGTAISNAGVGYFFPAATGTRIAVGAITIPAGASQIQFVVAGGGAIDLVQFRIGTSVTLGTITTTGGVVLDLRDGTAPVVDGTTLSAITLENLGSGYWLVRCTLTLVSALTRYLGWYPVCSASTSTNGTTDRLLFGAFSIGNSATYQKVTSANLVEQAGVTNVSGVRGDGTDDFLNSGITAVSGSHFFAAAGQGCCIAIPLVMLPGASGTIFGKCGSTDANKQLHARVGTDGLLDIFVRGTEGPDLKTVADGLPHYLIYNQDGATATYMFDGMTETALTVGAAAEEILETFMLFARTIGTPALFGRYRLGLDELVVVSRSLTLAERQQLMLNAANNFGVTLS